MVCVFLQLRLEKEAEQRLAHLSELAHDEAVLWVGSLSYPGWNEGNHYRNVYLASPRFVMLKIPRAHISRENKPILENYVCPVYAEILVFIGFREPYYISSVF